MKTFKDLINQQLNEGKKFQSISCEYVVINFSLETQAEPGIIPLKNKKALELFVTEENGFDKFDIDDIVKLRSKQSWSGDGIKIMRIV